MKDLYIENRLVAARPYRKGAYSTFTTSVMRNLGSNAAFGEAARETNKLTGRNLFSRFMKLHRALAIAVVILAVASISFTSYAYAIGSNPVSLIRRWISEDQVNVEYEGRTFQYGSKRTYSDAAITAFAELNTIFDLHFKASNAFQIPQNGSEHVSNPYDTEYVYPWIGTIERIDDSTVYIRKQYTPGDKISSATNDNQLVTLPRQRMQFFRDGEHAEITDPKASKFVEVFQDAYLEHGLGSEAPPVPIKQFFVFELTHTLDQIKEADQGNQAGQKATNASELGIFEPSWGGLSDVCLNNGADKCDVDKQGRVDGESLYEAGTSQSGPIGPQIKSNPNVIPFGEAVMDPSKSPKGLIMRNTQGVITEINSSNIILKSSSGTLWTLSYTAEQQKNFSQSGHKPLGVGDKLEVNLVGSVNNLNTRQFDDKHIYEIQRY